VGNANAPLDMYNIRDHRLSWQNEKRPGGGLLSAPGRRVWRGSGISAAAGDEDQNV
jgi:hypothetical protein